MRPVYVWWDRIHEPVVDADLRKQHHEISDEEWQQLFAAARDRCERELLQALKRFHPELFTSSEFGRLRAALFSSTFGPGRPSPETLAELGLTETGAQPQGTAPDAEDETQESQREERSAA
jgi:hypothetical protein